MLNPGSFYRRCDFQSYAAKGGNEIPKAKRVKGPALALLLAGPALSLPNLLVLGKIFGAQRTLVYAGLVVLMATITGYIYGHL